MALIKCPKCEQEISDRGEICPYCRTWLKENHSTQETQNTTQQCPKCGNTIFKDICPYCHIDISQTRVNKIPTAEQTANTKKIEKVVSVIVGILLIIGLLFLISQCAKDDGTCERCNKEGIYEIGGDKYCEKHYLDVLGELITWDGD